MLLALSSIFIYLTPRLIIINTFITIFNGVKLLDQNTLHKCYNIIRCEFNAKFSLVLVGLNRNWSISFYLYESSSWWQDAKKME